MPTKIKPNKKKVTPETAIKKDVKQYLSIKGWFHFPVTQGLGAYKGIPDIIAVKAKPDLFCTSMTVHVLFIEVKTATGKLSSHQEAFKENIENQFGEYLIVRSVDDLIQYGI